MEQELAAGKYTSGEELAVEAVRSLHERERRVKTLPKEILPALERLDRGAGESLDAEASRREARSDRPSPNGSQAAEPRAWAAACLRHA
jgi:hypothetical protein